MNAQPLVLNKISHSAAQASTRIGAGCTLEFELKQAKGMLTLTPVATLNQEQLSKRMTPGGGICLNNVYGFIRMLTPMPLQNDDQALKTLFWDLAISYLAAPLKPLLGNFAQLDDEVPDTGVSMECLFNWQIQCAEQIQAGQLSMSGDTLAYWLNQAPWQYQDPPAPKQLKLSIALILGRFELFCRAFKALEPGDVVFPQKPQFDTTGKGQITLGKQQVELQWQRSNEYQVTAITERAMTTSEPTATPVEPDDELDKFDDVELQFTIEAGQLSLPLKQLRTLSIGSILTAEGFTPGQAYLRHRNMVVGRGQLVDVDGRLGLQLQSVEVGHAD